MLGHEVMRIDLGAVNCYLGKTQDGFILFDTGGYTIFDRQFTNRRERLIAELGKVGCRPEHLKLIVLTHGDFDHTANAAYLRDKYEVPVAMHVGDLRLTQDLSLETLMASVDLDQYRSFMVKAFLRLMKKRVKEIIEDVADDFERFEPDVLIDEGFELKEYGFDGVVLHLPGHTDGSIGVLTSDRALICGDTLTNVFKPDKAPNAADFKKLEESVQRIKHLNINLIYPGHGKPFHLDGGRKIK